MDQRLPALIHDDGAVLKCNGCGRSWRRPAEINQQNLAYLTEHTLDHRPLWGRRPSSLPPGPRQTAWSSASLEPVECQTCYLWFTGRRCPRCFPPYLLRRDQDPRPVARPARATSGL